MLWPPKNVIGHYCYNRNLLMTANKDYLNKRPLLKFASRLVWLEERLLAIRVCYYACQHWQLTNWDNCFIYKKKVGLNGISFSKKRVSARSWVKDRFSKKKSLILIASIIPGVIVVFTSGACLRWIKIWFRKKSEGFRKFGDNFKIRETVLLRVYSEAKK